MSFINSIDPNLWGPHGWAFLHYITLSYPDKPTQQDKNNIITFFNSVGNVLPCEKCRYNFDSHLKKFPLDNNTVNSRYNLVNWLVNIHNEVNLMNGKKTVSFDESVQIYLNKNNKFKWDTLIVYVFIIAFIIYFLLKYL
jgi:hypothetical protein